MELTKLETQQTMSSLEIAELTGKEHSNILRDIRNYVNELGGGFKIESSSYKSEQNKDMPMYLLNKEQSLLLVSGYSIQLRHKIIKRWLELESNRLAPKQLTNRELALMVIAESDRADKAELKIKVDAPKVLTYNKVLDTKLLINIRNSATQLGIPERQFVGLLIDKKYLYRSKDNKNTLLPYSQYKDTYFKVIPVACPDGKSRLQTMLTFDAITNLAPVVIDFLSMSI